MEKSSKKTYWPHMILGFLAVGLTLGYWTIKSASSMPVQEVNQYMMKYQEADITINEIMAKKAAFDKSYTIIPGKKEMMVMSDNIHSRLPQADAVRLSKGANSFSYTVTTKQGEPVSHAKVTFLLTQPHSRKQDKLFQNVPFTDEAYRIKDVDIQQPGRYLLQVKAEVGETIGYYDLPAYLEP